MIGRQVTAALRRPLQARLSTTAAPQPHFNLVIRTFTHASRLLEGPTGRPRKAVGEPSRPVKRAVKAAAKKPANPEKDAAAKKLAEKQKAAGKKLAEKKLAEKQKLAKQRVADKARAIKEREQLKLEKKNAAAAARAAKRTPEQLARSEKRSLMNDTRALKKAALQPPTLNVLNSAWGQFTIVRGKELSGLMKDQDRETKIKVFREHSKEVAAAYKELSSAEREHYNHLAHSAKDAALAEYKRWVEAHSVEEIKAANTVRRILRMREGLPKQGKSKWLNIKDERQTARPMSAFLFFVVARHASGDFKGIIPSDRTKLIAQEWKALSEEEKSKYEKLAKQDRERWEEETGKVSQASVASDSDS